MIDIHCHLDEFPDWHSLLVPELEKVVTAALGRQSIERTLGMRHEKVVMTAGCDCRAYEPGLVEYIRSIADRLVGIGEVGLDWFPKKREEQIEPFRGYIALARELDLPIVVHSRSAGKHALRILFDSGAERVVMHAFDGNSRAAKEAVERGYFFSIPPSIVRSEQKQKLVSALPLKNLLLESDAPALGPKRGEKNVPANVTVSAREIARIKELKPDEVKKVTTKNAKALFRF